jgi:hypothetical protein
VGSAGKRRTEPTECYQGHTSCFEISPADITPNHISQDFDPSPQSAKKYAAEEVGTTWVDLAPLDAFCRVLKVEPGELPGRVRGRTPEGMVWRAIGPAVPPVRNRRAQFRVLP